MSRPTFLVVESEPGNALSTRKLVLETAKYNVLTAHSWGEAAELLAQFPRVDAVIVGYELGNGNACEDFVKHVKGSTPSPPTVYLTPHHGQNCSIADHNVRSHDPGALLELMRSLFGDPRPDDSK